jgi:acrylyl-CoA reductase (NADPH)
MFRAWWVEKSGERPLVSLRELDESRLEGGNVLVRIAYSTINYKDGLCLTGKAPIVRRFPMVPGVDFSGVVERSDHPAWKPGDRVIMNGWGSGETRWGGLAQWALTDGDLLVRVPAALDLRQAMALGTAGYTAALAVLTLERHGLRPGDEVLVTGATGGVGGVATLLLSRRGFRVAASTGKLAEEPFLRSLGAFAIVDRKELAAPARPLGKERWAGVVENVGSHTLASAVSMTRTHGAVASCGNASGMDYPGSVAPFILRGVTLYGIDSNTASPSLREAAWARLASDVDPAKLEGLTREVALADALSAAEEIVAAKVRGRIVVNVNR